MLLDMLIIMIRLDEISCFYNLTENLHLLKKNKICNLTARPISYCQYCSRICFHTRRCDMSREGCLQYLPLQKDILQIEEKKSLRSNTEIAINLRAKKHTLISLSVSLTHTEAETPAFL